MIDFETFLARATVSKKTLDRFLDESKPTWARFDPEVGYTLGRYLPCDGIDESWTISTSQSDGRRTSWMYADKPCRLNTYGNSFTQCHQVSDGETWQEYLAGHLGEPVRNFGMGGFGVNQAYRVMRRIESSDLGADHVILYIWGDDHNRSVMRCRHAATYRVWEDLDGRMFHGNFWANVEMDLDTGDFVERPSLLPSAEELYRMCDPEFMVEALKDDLMVMLYAMGSFEVEGNIELLDRLAECLGVVGVRDTGPRIADIERLKSEYGFAASRFVVQRVGEFLNEFDKKLLICLLCPRATDQALRGVERYDKDFVDYLIRSEYRVFDMNEVHRRDFRDFALSIDDYRRRYWIGHYSPPGNHFFAYNLKNSVVEWLDPKPRTYRGEDMTQIQFDGYLPELLSRDRIQPD